MNKYVLCLTALSFALLTFSSFGFSEKSQNTSPEELIEKIHWLCQSAVKIDTDGQVIYFDPYRIKKSDKADIILISHKHDDHLSVGDISKIAHKNTVFIAPEDCVQDLAKVKKSKIIPMEPGMKTNVNGILIEAVPAYNIVKTKFHPKENKWMGYTLTIHGVKIYHAGDTERIPEMKDFTCDIAMVPLGQTYTMNDVKEAANAVIDTQAKIAIPIHYGLYEGKADDAVEFKKLLKDKVNVIIKKQE
ncbi:MAG: MBL fold metallo-hydrolase [bacterium]